MRRLLLLALMYAVFVGARGAVFPPTGAVWTRIAGNPLIEPDVAWENTAVSEAMAMWRTGTTIDVFYRGGWATAGLGYATFDTSTMTLTKSVSNPVLGQGGSGFAGHTFSPFVYLESSTYHACFTATTHRIAHR